MYLLKNFFSNVLWLSFVFLSNTVAQALPQFEPVEDVFVRAIQAHDVLTPDTESSIGIEFNLPDGWHIYWQNPGDSGLPPKAKLVSDDVEAGQLQYPAPLRFVAFDIVGYGYKDHTLLQLPIKLTQQPDNTVVTRQLDVDFLMCKDICIPGSFSANLQWQTGAVAQENSDAQIIFAQYPLPKMAPIEVTIQGNDAGFLLTHDSAQITGFIPAQNGMIDDTVKAELRAGGVFVVRDSWTDAPTALSGLIQLDGIWYQLKPTGILIQNDAIEADTAGQQVFWWLLVSALLAGIILNLMPCVLPILALKVLAFSKGEGQAHAGAYTFGILAGFWCVAGVIAALQWAGMSVGWGFHLQNPFFVAGLAVLMVLIALNLLSVFYLPTPRMLSGHRYDAGSSGAFFTGLLAVVVATPCTAPFMGGAVAYALTQGVGSSFAIFTAMGLGLALPYIVLAHVPAARRMMPKPGLWMETLKNILAFPLLATALWLMWVFTNLTSVNMGFMLATLLLATAFFIWLYGAGQRQTKPRAWLWLLPLLGVLIFGLPQFKESTASHWQTWSAAAMNNALANDQIAFVDVTADWCVTCKFTELTVLNRGDTQALFAQHDVEQFQADWTDADPQITALLEQFNRKGVPLYLLYFPSGQTEVLSQLPTYSEIKNVLETIE